MNQNQVDIVVRGRHLEVSTRFRDHATDKLSRLDRFGVPLSRIDVEVSKELNPRQSDRAYEVELTCRGRGPVIRAEAAANDKYAALDVAYSRLEERLRRAGERRRFHRHGRAATASASSAAPPLESDEVVGARLSVVDDMPRVSGSAHTANGSAPATTGADDVDDVVYAAGPVVVREKTHRAGPMTVEQALHAMELVGHDFFLFMDVDEGCATVVYRRRGFDYGLIRLHEESDVDELAENA